METKSLQRRKSIRILAVSVIATLFLFTVVVVVINVKLKNDIWKKILNRDAEAFYLFSMMDRSSNYNENLTDMVTPWINKNNALTPALWTSDLEGIIALQIFDAKGNIKSTIPETLIPAALDDGDFKRLQQLKHISKFHDKIWLTSLFDDPRFLLMVSPVPLLEVIIPVHSTKPRKLEAILQYWVEGNSMAKELAKLNRTIILQTGIALGILSFQFSFGPSDN